MTATGLIIALVIHLIICGIAGVLIWRGLLRVPGAFFVIILLVPVVGFLSMLGVEWTLRRKYDPQLSDEILSVGKSTTPYGMITVEGGDSPNVVPLEEALLINDVGTRRAIMQDILRRDPMRYVELLKIARLNDDMEVTHYATTTIMEIQRNFELSLQQLDREQMKSQEDISANDESIDVLSRYLASGLLEGYPQERMRIRYNHALERKSDIHEYDRQNVFRLADNKAKLGDIAGAETEIERMIEQWPDDEEAWLLGLYITVESQDKQKLNLWLDRMQRSAVRWSAQGKDILRFWTGIETAASAGIHKESVSAL